MDDELCFVLGGIALIVGLGAALLVLAASQPACLIRAERATFSHFTYTGKVMIPVYTRKCLKRAVD